MPSSTGSETIRDYNRCSGRRISISIATGNGDTATMPIVTSEKFCFTIGTLPKS